MRMPEVRWCLFPSAVVLLAVIAGLAVSGAASAGCEADATPTPAAAGKIVTYELVDTWEYVPWELRPGFVYEPLDVTSTPDGRLFVIDRRPDATYLHIFDDGENPTRVVRLNDEARQARLDASRDGTVWTVGQIESSDAVPEGRKRFLVEQYGSAGELLFGFHIDLPERTIVTDIAVAPEGWIYVSRHDSRLKGDTLASAIDVLDHDGNLIDVIDSADYHTVDHSIPGHVHLLFTRVDVAPTGVVWAATRFVLCT